MLQVGFIRRKRQDTERAARECGGRNTDSDRGCDNPGRQRNCKTGVGRPSVLGARAKDTSLRRHRVGVWSSALSISIQLKLSTPAPLE